MDSCDGVVAHLYLLYGTLPKVAPGDTQLWTAASAACLALALILMLWRGRGRDPLDMNKVPGPWKDEAWPVLGNLPSLVRLDVHRQILKWANQYGGVYRVNMMWLDGLVVTDPAALASICGRGEGACDKAWGFYRSINGMTSRTHQPNLLTSPADNTWYAVRKAVAQSFSFNNIKRKLPLMLERVEAMMARLRELGPDEAVDMDGVALRVTVDIIGQAGFGYSFNAVEQPLPAPSDHLLRILPRCFSECMLRLVNPLRAWSPWLWPLPKPGFFGWGRRGRQSLLDFQAEMQKLLAVVSSRGPPADDDSDLGTQLWRLVHEGKVSKERVLSEIGILFVEGFETTGHTISWTLLQIATTPGVQERVAAELESVGLLAKSGSGSKPRQVELEDLKKLRYLTACIKESMRMYPVVSLMGRVTERATQMGPYLIPAGVEVAIPLFAIHNAERNWEAPEQFRPDRWLDVPVESYVASPGMLSGGGGDGGERKEEGKAICFMPFSEGPRSCVGQTLAKLEVMVVLASILGSFRICLAPSMGGLEGVRQRESTLLTLQTSGLQGIQFNLRPWAEVLQHEPPTREV